MVKTCGPSRITPQVESRNILLCSTACRNRGSIGSKELVTFCEIASMRGRALTA